MKAWHFLRADGKLNYPPHTQVAVGQKLTVDPDLIMPCAYGLHASVNILDALSYAPGPIICRVELSGRIIKDSDKVVASERTVLAMANAAEVLYEFAYRETKDKHPNWPFMVVPAPRINEDVTTSAARWVMGYAHSGIRDRQARRLTAMVSRLLGLGKG